MILTWERLLTPSRDKRPLQSDLDRLEHWAVINSKNFNKSKCQIVHLGWSNARHKYGLREQPCRKGSGGAGQHQAQQESAGCPGSPEAKPLPGVHQTEHNHPVRRGNHPTVFSIGTASP